MIQMEYITDYKKVKQYLDVVFMNCYGSCKLVKGIL